MISSEEEPFATIEDQRGINYLDGAHLLRFFCNGKPICIGVIGNNQGLSFFVCSLHGKIQGPNLFGIRKFDGWEVRVRRMLFRDRHEVPNP